MANTPTTSEPRAGRVDEAATPRRTLPVLVWAGVGAVFVALQTYVYASWVLSDRFTPTSTGSTPVPTWMKVVIRSYEVASVSALVLVIVLVVIRPMRRDGRISPDGLFVLACLTMYWQDAALSFSQIQFTYNPYFINMGSWYADIPGWISPNGNRIAEPLLAIFPLYGSIMFLGCLLASKVMRHAKARWPRLSRLELVGICIVFFFAFDLLCEIVWLRLGFYTYGGSARRWTLFAGHYYQVPIHLIGVTAVWYSAIACVRHFRNERGETVVERGIAHLHLTGRRRSFVRFLALAGVLNVIWLGTNVVLQVPGLHSDSWPADIQERSYLTDGICGPGTDYACPGPGVPVPTRVSGHVRPDGSFAPAGAKGGFAPDHR